MQEHDMNLFTMSKNQLHNARKIDKIQKCITNQDFEVQFIIRVVNIDYLLA